MSLIQKTIIRKHVPNLNRFLMTAIRRCSDNHPNIIRSPSTDVVLPEMTIPEFVYSRIAPYSKYTAVECASTGKSYNYGEIIIKSQNLGKALRKKLKLQNNDIVAILLPNTPDYLLSALGIISGKMALTSLNPMYTIDEISRQLLDSSAKAIITNNSLHNNAKAALRMMKKQLPIITVKMKNGESLPDGAVSFEELISTKVDMPDFEPGDIHSTAFVPYSSGTTGLPKGVELSHYTIISNILQSIHEDISPYVTTSDGFQDITPAVLPFYHIYGFSTNLINPLFHGSKLVTLERFHPDSYISVLQKHQISLIFAAPPLFLFMTAHPEVRPEYLKNLRTLISGAAPLGSSDEDRFFEKFGNHIHIGQGYGMTEASPLIAFSNKSMKHSSEARGSVGPPIPNTLVKIINPDDVTAAPLGPNEPGEILIKGPQVMKGYLNKPEETANTMLEGWLRTGDIGRYNEKRLLFITDRLKELIKVKGYQVAPAELEEVIRSHPKVEDAAVIGIPHQRYGEVPRAYVVPKCGEELKEETIQSFVNQKLAKYKHLNGGVQIIDSIPKNPSGKILRKQLKSNYHQEGI